MLSWFKPSGGARRSGTLAALKPGQTAKIVALDGKGPLVQRLYEMGLLEGFNVTLVRRAPLGDPLEVHEIAGAVNSVRGQSAGNGGHVRAVKVSVDDSTDYPRALGALD